MTTVAEIEGKELTSLSELLAAADVPGDLVTLDGDVGALLDRALFTDATFQSVENGYLGRILLVLDQEVALAPFGDALQVILAPAGDLTVCDAELSFEARAGGFVVGLGLLDLSVVLRVDGTILRPLLPDSSEPDPNAATLDIAIGSADVRLATERPVAVEFDAGPAVPRCMIGETGIIVAARGVRCPTTPRSPSTTPSWATAGSPPPSPSRASASTDRWPASTSRSRPSASRSSRTP